MNNTLFIWINAILIFYILPIIFCYKYNKITYSKGGTQEHLNPLFGDLVITFFPIVNLIACLMCWITDPPSYELKEKRINKRNTKKQKNSNNINRFFNINK